MEGAGTRFAALALWVGVAALMVIPVVVAATSPYLASRNPAYILGGFAGILALSMFLIQPLLAARLLPGLHPMRARRWHGALGVGILAAVVLHVVGLAITSPPDMIDALMLRAPTWFSVFGVLALWGTVVAAGLAMVRRLSPRLTRRVQPLHHGIGAVVILATVVHALLIQGTMGQISKIALCVAAVAAVIASLVPRRRR